MHDLNRDVMEKYIHTIVKYCTSCPCQALEL